MSKSTGYALSSGLLACAWLALSAPALGKEKCPEVCPDGSRPYFCVCPVEESGPQRAAPPAKKAAPPPQPSPDCGKPGKLGSDRTGDCAEPVRSGPAGRKKAPPAEGAAPPAGKEWHDPKTGMTFVWIEGGRFSMGCGAWTSDCGDEEKPVHPVILTGYWLAKTEVTQQQWQAVMRDNPSDNTACGPDCPVEQVSWEDAQTFIGRLNKKGDGKYRLPTEAEWEFACRSGGRPEPHAGGQEANAVAWHGDNSREQPSPVGKKAPNGLGLYDLSGNVWEWVEDWYFDYPKREETDPVYEGADSEHVMRGGSWYDEASDTRCTARYGSEADTREADVGLRLARDP